MTDKRHWARNEETLEEYLLGRIDPSLRKEMEQHLNACEACRTLVEEETALAAGIRKAGAAKTKEQLRLLIGVKERGIPWPHLFSMAAALLLIIGVGIYNRWLFRALPPPAPRQMIVERKRMGAEEPQKAKEHDELASADARNEQRGPVQQRPAESMRDEQPEPAGSGFAADLAEEQKVGSASGSYPLTAYVLGKSVRAMPQSETEGKSRDDAVALKSVGKKERAARDEIRTGNLVVRFARRDEQASHDFPNALSCTLERVDSYFHLTIYMTPDLTVPESSGVTAYLASQDSLIVEMNSTSIGIRLPAELSGLVAP